MPRRLATLLNTIVLLQSSFVVKSFGPIPPKRRIRTHISASSSDDAKFGFGQRIESIKTLAVGGLVGPIAILPLSALHEFVLLPSTTAQWEFDNDAASLTAGLFAIVYRYAVRKDDNPQLQSGVVGAFVLTRTLARVQVPTYCLPIPLNCGDPLHYLDWNMLYQLGVNFVESYVLFGAAAAAVNYCFYRNIISKFP